MYRFRIPANSGRAELVGGQTGGLTVRDREAGAFRISYRERYFGFSDAAELEEAAFDVSEVLLDTFALDAAGIGFSNAPLTSLHGVHDFGVGAGPGMVLTISGAKLEPGNPEKARLEVRVGGNGAPVLVGGFLIDRRVCWIGSSRASAKLDQVCQDGSTFLSS